MGIRKRARRAPRVTRPVMAAVAIRGTRAASGERRGKSTTRNTSPRRERKRRDFMKVGKHYQ